MEVNVKMGKNNAAVLSIFSNSLLIIFKFSAGLLIGSVSVISEAIHSSIDLIASFIAYFSIKKASKAEDYEHPFGHGKYENLSGFVEAMLIFLAAALIIFESVKKIICGSNIEAVGPGLLVMGIAALVNLFISLTLKKIAQKTNSIALEADGAHLFTDVITAFGVFLGLLLVKITGIKIIDPITAVIVGFLIIKTSIDLTKKSMKDLVDSKLSDEDINKLLIIINSHKEIKGYHNLRTRQCGNEKQIDIHLNVDRNSSLIQAHDICDIIEKEINNVFPKSYIVIHAEPETQKKQLPEI